MKRISDYDTIDSVFEDEMVLKGSRFIGILMPCRTEEEIPVCIATVTERYRNATHYCYGAIFNGSERKEKSSDNGEPSGTAGKPIMFMLKGSGLSDVICIVVRYFGGTLLGTGGLVHAYTEGVRIALEKSRRFTRVACAVYRFTLDYNYYNVFEAKCRDLMARNPQCDYSDKVDVKAWIRVDDDEEFVRRITDLTERHVMLKPCDDEYIDLHRCRSAKRSSPFKHQQNTDVHAHKGPVDHEGVRSAESSEGRESPDQRGRQHRTHRSERCRQEHIPEDHAGGA